MWQTPSNAGTAKSWDISLKTVIANQYVFSAVQKGTGKETTDVEIEEFAVQTAKRATLHLIEAV